MVTGQPGWVGQVGGGIVPQTKSIELVEMNCRFSLRKNSCEATMFTSIVKENLERDLQGLVDTWSKGMATRREQLKTAQLDEVSMHNRTMDWVMNMLGVEDRKVME